MRFRNILLGLGGLLMVLILIMADPHGGVIAQLPFGSGALATFITLFTSILFVGVLHICRKGLFDYLDLEVYFKKALETSEGAGMALQAVAISMVAISIVIFVATK